MKSESRRRLIAGALRAARAAAFLTLATGINGTIAALQPRYEAIYVYLVTIVVVAWIGSLLLGVTTAVIAVVLYDWLFGPQHAALSVSSIVPFVVAIGAAVVTRLARAPVERRQFAYTRPPQLLERSPLDVVPATPAADSAEADALRQQIADLQGAIEEARRTSEHEQRLRIEQANAARTRVTALQHDVDTFRSDALEQAKRAADLQRQLDEAIRRDSSSSGRLEALERDAETRRTQTAELEQRAAELTQELEVAWRRVDEEKARHEAEAARLSALERQANDALQRAVAGLAARYQQPLAEAKERLAEAFTRMPVLEKERDDARRAAKEAQARLTAMQQDLDRVEQEVGAARATADRERLDRERLTAEFDSKLGSIVAGLTTDHENAIAEALLEKESARAEVRSLTQKLESVQQRLAGFDALQAQTEKTIADLRNAVAAERSRADAEKAAREELNAEWDAKLQTIVTNLATDHEADLGQAMLEREEARAEARELRAQLESKTAELQRALEGERNRGDAERAARENLNAEWDQKLQTIVTNLASDHEADLGQAMLEREEARAEARELRAQLESKTAELRRALEADQSTRDKLNAEWDDKLQKIVTNLASDHEADLGQAMLDKEAARAEAREMRSQLERERSRADAEKAAREKLDAEWSDKLQKIVTNLASDHESDIGEAMLAKEAARAEARELRSQLEKKTADLQRAVEAERNRADAEKAAREKLDAEWSEKLQTIVSHLASDHEADLGEAMLEKEAARAETRELRGRVKTLQQQLDQERQRQRSAPTAGGDTSRPAVVLVVHSDAGTRAMTKHALEQAGYAVLTAADGLEGLRIASARRPDVVLAEAVMPKMNGRELVQLLKARSETADVKIVLISGGDGGGTERATDFRADDVVATPADFAALRVVLANVLSKETN